MTPGGPAELPRRARWLYAASSAGSEALGQSRGLWLVYFYAPPAGADRPTLLVPALVGVILAIGRVIGALDDLIIGWWSDRFRSSLGRRIPFVLLGTPLWALFALLQFMPPAGGDALVAAYLLVIIEAFSIFSTVSGGPYEALLPELAPGNDARVRLIALRVYFGVAGAAIGLIGSGLIVDRFGFSAMAVSYALLALIARYTGLAGIWRHAPRASPPAAIPLRESLRLTFRHPAFLAFLPSFVLFQAGISMITGVLPYVVSALLGESDEGLWTAILTATAILSMLAGLPIFARLSRRASIHHAYRRAMLAAAAAFPLLAVVGLIPGLPVRAEALLILLIAGFPLAGVYLFPTALTAEIADDDTRRTGFQREATYFGAQNFVEKTTGAFAPLALGLVLMLGRDQGDALGVRLAGPVAGLIVLAGFLAFRRYNLAPEDTPAPGR